MCGNMSVFAFNIKISVSDFKYNTNRNKVSRYSFEFKKRVTDQEMMHFFSVNKG